MLRGSTTESLCRCPKEIILTSCAKNPSSINNGSVISAFGTTLHAHAHRVPCIHPHTPPICMEIYIRVENLGVSEISGLLVQGSEEDVQCTMYIRYLQFQFVLLRSPAEKSLYSCSSRKYPFEEVGAVQIDQQCTR